jgi:hypothetical protein
MMVVGRPEQPLGAAEQATVVLVPRHSPAGLERLHDLRRVMVEAGGDIEEAGHEHRAVLVGEDHGLLRRQREHLRGAVVCYVTLRGLSGQPFADHALRRAGSFG